MLAIDKHIQMMSIDERKVTMEPMEAVEDVPLDKSNPKMFTRIGISMEMKTKQELVHFLKKSMDVFAWSHKDMPGIDLSVITHGIDLSLSLYVKRREFLLPKEIMLLKKKSKS